MGALDRRCFRGPVNKCWYVRMRMECSILRAKRHRLSWHHLHPTTVRNKTNPDCTAHKWTQRPPVPLKRAQLSWPLQKSVFVCVCVCVCVCKIRGCASVCVNKSRSENNRYSEDRPSGCKIKHKLTRMKKNNRRFYYQNKVWPQALLAFFNPRITADGQYWLQSLLADLNYRRLQKKRKSLITFNRIVFISIFFFLYKEVSPSI